MALVLNAFRLALSAISRNKTRAGLTVLGILIGVAAVVAVSTLGASASAQVSGKIEGLGTNVMFIFPQSTQSSGARNKSVGRLTENDARAIVRDSVSVADASPYLGSTVQVVAGDKNASTQIIGTTLAYMSIRNFRVGTGELWTETDETLKTKVCVVGAVVAENLFGTDDPVGRTIRIGRAPYRILGVLARRGTSPFGEDEDDRILMHIGSYRARVQRTAPGRADMIVASSTSERTTDRAVSQIVSVLRQRHRIADGAEPDFVVRTQAEFRERQEGIAQALRALLLSVAAVSLLVGGIGVMNIMLVSVAERTREIGTRMAIGARERDIRIQFLVEAVVLSLVGGGLGIVVGVSGCLGLGHLLDWPMRPNLASLVLAVGTSAAIGVLFGYLPAQRAARLDPIDALRAD